MSSDRLGLHHSYYLYGGGIYCKAVLNSISNKPKAILDRNLHGQRILGIPVYHPEADSLNKNVQVYNTILGYGDIASYLKGIGFIKIHDTKKTFSDFPASLEKLNSDGEFWRVKNKNEKVDKEKTDFLRTILQDDISHKTLDQLVNYRINPCAENYPWPEYYEMYAPDNIEGLYDDNRDVNILDCGAFDGDTAILYEKIFGNKIKNYVAVEPSLKNVNKLKLNIEHLSGIKNLIVIEKGLGDKETYAFLKEAGSASNVYYSESGNHVEITTIESILKYTGLDFDIIKVDIEGYDRAAIFAALQYIAKKRPILCLSVYHKPDDLWGIALDIYNVVGDGYHYYLRNEGHWGYETILYCVPNSY